MPRNGNYSTIFCFQAGPLLYVTEWVTLALYSRFWVFTEVVTVQFSCYMAAGAMWNCCCLCACSEYTMNQLTVWLYSSHIHRIQVCLAVTTTSHFHFFAKWLRSFTCYSSNMGVEWILKSAQKVDPGEENYPARTWTPHLSITSLSLYHWAVSAPRYQ